MADKQMKQIQIKGGMIPKQTKFGNWKVKFFKAQEEIERLTKERDMYADDLYWKAEVRKREDFITELTVENAELQKQVDELKEKNTDLCLDKQDLMNEISEHKNAYARLNEAYVNLNKFYEKAVKDTAKEILDEVSKHFGGKWLVELYKKYGLSWNTETE